MEAGTRDGGCDESDPAAVPMNRSLHAIVAVGLLGVLASCAPDEPGSALKAGPDATPNGVIDAVPPAIPEPVPHPEASADQRTRLTRYHSDCGQGVARGCAALGQVHLEGAWVAKDEGRAREMYARACALGERCAMYGVLLYQGVGGAEDPDQAFALWSRDCAAHDPEGCAHHGIALQRGIGTQTDLPGARRSFGEACDAGQVAACTNLGFMLQGAEGGPLDMPGARAAYDKACKGGDSAGCNNLGLVSLPVDSATLISPAPGSVQRRTPLPVGVALPAAFAKGTVGMRLDGAPADVAGATIRGGRTPVGRGALLIALLRDLTPGPHRIEVTATAPDGQSHRVEGAFTYAPPPCRIALRVEDGDAKTTGARVVVHDRGGPVDLAPTDAARLDTMGRDSSLHSVLLPQGTGGVQLESGWYRLVATRTLREDVGVWEGELCGEGTPDSLTLQVPTVLPTPGRLLADLHVHTAESGDAFTPHPLRADSLRASGLDLAVLTDHDRVTGADVLGWEGAMPGAEITLQSDPSRASAGHLNVFPLPPETALSPDGAPDLETLLAERPSGSLVQINHPRGIQFRPDNPARPQAHALFTHAGLDRDAPLNDQPLVALLAKADAVEVLNRFAWSRYQEVRADWFALMNAGIRMTATGNSDSHGLALEQLGLPANLVTTTGLDGLAAAIQAGKVGVSTGPVVDLVVTSGDTRATPGDTLRVSNAAVEVELRVRAAPWVPVAEIRLVHDGVIVHRQALTETEAIERIRVVLPQAVVADGWIVAEAGWPIDDTTQTSPEVGGLYAQVAPGYVPIGFTNAVWLDAP
jgi:hypothetical protein